jgi:hypothetical protein
VSTQTAAPAGGQALRVLLDLLLSIGRNFLRPFGNRMESLHRDPPINAQTLVLLFNEASDAQRMIQNFLPERFGQGRAAQLPKTARYQEASGRTRKLRPA